VCSIQQLLVILAGIAVLFLVELLREKKKGLSRLFFQKKLWVRWMVCVGILMMVVVYGAYGDSYEQTEFIYFQF